MKILHVIQAIAPRYGGPSTNIWPLMAALSRLGNQVELAATDADGPGARVDRAMFSADVPLHLFERTFSEQWKYSRGLGRWLPSHAREFDVVHIHGLWAYPTVAAARAAERAGVPYVIRPAGMLSPYTWSSGRFKKRAYWWLAERRTVRHATAIHVTSPEEAAEVRACGIAAPLLEAPNGLEPAAFDTPARSSWLRDRCGPAAGDRPIILFLSRLHPKKGVSDVLVPAVAAMRSNAFLAIAGGVDSTTAGYGDEVRAAIERYGIGSRTALLGPLTPEDRWAAYDGAAVFCLPSHNENFGTVVPEALARGCPVVVTSGVAAGALAVEAGAGAVVPRTPEAVASALESQLTNSADRSALAVAGRELVRARLSWDSIGKQIHVLYQELVSARRGGKVLPIR